MGGHRIEFVHQPSASNRIGDRLKENLAAPWTRFRAAIAFVKRSGTRHVAPALAAFARTRDIEIIVGIDHGGSSAEGLRDLLDAVAPAGRVIVFHNRLPFTFHPKIHLFQSPVAAELTVGSGNLTQGGLFTNYEAALRVSLNLDAPGDSAILRSVEQTLDAWSDLSTGAALVLDEALLARLTASGVTPSEIADSTGPAATDGVKEDHGGRIDYTDPLFAARAEPGPPAVPAHSSAQQSVVELPVVVQPPKIEAPDPPELTPTHVKRRDFMSALFEQARDEGIDSPFRNRSPSIHGILHVRARGAGLVYRVAVNSGQSRVVLTNTVGKWLGALKELEGRRAEIDAAFKTAGLPETLEWYREEDVQAGRWVIRYTVDAGYEDETGRADKMRELNQASAALKRVFQPHIDRLPPELEEEAASEDLAGIE